MQRWLLHPDLGPVEVRLEGRIVKLEGAKAAAFPFVSPLAARQGLTSRLASLHSEGFLPCEQEDAALWIASRGLHAPEALQAFRDEAWTRLGHPALDDFASLTLSDADGSVSEPDLTKLFADPRVDLISELRIQEWQLTNEGRSNYESVTRLLSLRRPMRLRMLELDMRDDPELSRSSEVGQIDGLLALPMLETLHIVGRAQLSANPRATKTLRTLYIEGELARDEVASLVQLPCPSLLAFTLRTHDGELTEEHISRLFSRTDLVCLRRLSLGGLHLSPALIRIIARSPLLTRLESLALEGTVDDKVAADFLLHTGAFEHLHDLALPEAALTNELEATFPSVRPLSH